MIITFISHGWVIAWLTHESGVSCPSPWPPLFLEHLPLVPFAFFSCLSIPARDSLYWVLLVVLLILLTPRQQNSDLDRCVHLWGWTEGLSYIPLCLDTKSNHSVQFSCSVMSESLQPHGLQHARPPCPSPTPRVYSNSCPLSWWCHPTVSSFVIPFSSCLQSFPASESLQMSQFFASGGQSVGVSASISVLPMNIQDWFPLGWTGWISLKSKGLSRVFSNTTVQKHQFFGAQPSSQSNSHIHTWPQEKP